MCERFANIDVCVFLQHEKETGFSPTQRESALPSIQEAHATSGPKLGWATFSQIFAPKNLRRRATVPGQWQQSQDENYKTSGGLRNLSRACSAHKLLSEFGAEMRTVFERVFLEPDAQDTSSPKPFRGSGRRTLLALVEQIRDKSTKAWVPAPPTSSYNKSVRASGSSGSHQLAISRQLFQGGNVQDVLQARRRARPQCWEWSLPPTSLRRSSSRSSSWKNNCLIMGEQTNSENTKACTLRAENLAKSEIHRIAGGNCIELFGGWFSVFRR